MIGGVIERQALAVVIALGLCGAGSSGARPSILGAPGASISVLLVDATTVHIGSFVGALVEGATLSARRVWVLKCRPDSTGHHETS